MIDRVCKSIQDSPVQEWKTIARRRIFLKREDRSAFGLGTKIRRFKGFLELDRNLPVYLKGSLNSNFLFAFCLLFRLAGYRIHTSATARNLNDQLGNGKLVRSLSHKFELGEENHFEDIDIQVVPQFGLSHLALKGMDSLWDEIDWKCYTHIVIDMGTGLGFLSGLDYLQRNPKKDIHFIGILLGEKISSWFSELPLLLKNLKLNFDFNPNFAPNTSYDININLASTLLNESHPEYTVNIIPPSILPRFGKQNSTLMEYIRRTYRDSGIPLEPFYSAKSLYTLEEKILDFPPDSEILYIHQGGLLNWVDLYR